MNLPYIQTELFRELVGMETMLESGYDFVIIRLNAALDISLFDSQNKIKKSWTICASKITNYDQITSEINRIWQEIPAECKKENLPI